jgi:hypothetical protein
MVKLYKDCIEIDFTNVIIFGSMLTPFCFFKEDDFWWIMLCGIQLIHKNKEFKWNSLPFEQWTYKIFNKKKLNKVG